MSQRESLPRQGSRTLLLYTCSICRESLGVQDHFRIMDEHFELSDRCRGGHYHIVELAPTGVEGYYSDVLRAQREREEADSAAA